MYLITMWFEQTCGVVSQNNNVVDNIVVWYEREWSSVYIYRVGSEWS